MIFDESQHPTALSIFIQSDDSCTIPCVSANQSTPRPCTHYGQSNACFIYQAFQPITEFRNPEDIIANEMHVALVATSTHDVKSSTIIPKYRERILR